MDLRVLLGCIYNGFPAYGNSCYIIWMRDGDKLRNLVFEAAPKAKSIYGDFDHVVYTESTLAIDILRGGASYADFHHIGGSNFTLLLSGVVYSA